MMQFDLTWRRLPLSLNVGKHWGSKLRERRVILDEVLVRARAAKLPTGLDRVHIVLHWLPVVERTRDTDNPAPSLKAVIDGLTQYGLVPDDNSHHVSSEVVIHPVTKGRHAQFWVTIEQRLDTSSSVDNEKGSV